MSSREELIKEMSNLMCSVAEGDEQFVTEGYWYNDELSKAIADLIEQKVKEAREKEYHRMLNVLSALEDEYLGLDDIIGAIEGYRVAICNLIQQNKESKQ